VTIHSAAAYEEREAMRARARRAKRREQRESADKAIEADAAEVRRIAAAIVQAQEQAAAHPILDRHRASRHEAAITRMEGNLRRREDGIRDMFDSILDCASLWAIDPRSPAAWALLTYVPEDVRRACFALLPWEVCPVYRILRRQPDPCSQGPQWRGGHRLEAIGQAYALTRERVRQIEVMAIDSCRKAMRAVDVEEWAEPREDHWERMAHL
jgi:hypothetical protein